MLHDSATQGHAGGWPCVAESCSINKMYFNDNLMIFQLRFIELNLILVAFNKNRIALWI
jgi:hypothetical protein